MYISNLNCIFFLNMSPKKMKNIKKRPLPVKIVLSILVVYTIYSIKVDIGIFIGDTYMAVVENDFHFDHSLCNPEVLERLLLKFRSKLDISSDDIAKLQPEQASSSTVGSVHKQISHSFHFPRYFQKPTEIITSAKIVHNASETTQKSLFDFTKLLQNEHVILDIHKNGRNVSFSDVIVRSGSRDQPERLSPLQRAIKERERLNEHRKLILSAQLPGTTEMERDKKSMLSAGKDIIHEPDVGQRKSQSSNTTTNEATTDVPSAHKEMINKTAAAVAAAASSARASTGQKQAAGSRRDRIAKLSNRGERRKNAVSRVVNVAPKSDHHKFTPYHIESIHPLHVDLEKFVQEKIENGFRIPMDPINPQKTDFVYQLTKCEFGSSVFNFSLLVIVRSNVRHLDMRSMIRDTWGSFKYPNVKLIFAVGSESQTVTDVYEEFKMYGDILQGNFSDNSANTTHKTTMAFKWLNDSCPDADVILLAEEDHLIQIRHILEYIKSINRREIKNLFRGFVISNAEVERDQKSRWSVRLADFRHKVWPPYLRRGCMLISRDVARKMTEAFPYVKYIHIYDAYLGIVAKKLSLTLQHDARFFQTGTDLLPSRDSFAFDGVNTPKLLNEAWNNLSNRRN
ncbi:uncharacterized protein [Argopecten irradians]|uniref:uncharacterized protein n=1 Tax=Argopecten irradians TaxID=31199 RepID=UPI0037117E56